MLRAHILAVGRTPSPHPLRPRHHCARASLHGVGLPPTSRLEGNRGGFLDLPMPQEVLGEMGPVEPTRSNAAHRDLPTWINVMEAPHEPLGGPLDLALAGGGSTEQTHAGR